MKLSEMTNGEATDALARLVDPIGRICDDEEAVSMIAEYRQSLRTKPLFYIIGRILPRLTKQALLNHKSDLYQIVAILGGMRCEDIDKLNFKETCALLRESYDDMLATFFSSSAASTRGGAGKPSRS